MISTTVICHRLLSTERDAQTISPHPNRYNMITQARINEATVTEFAHKYQVVREK